MSSDVMRVRLGLRQVSVLEVVADSPGPFGGGGGGGVVHVAVPVLRVQVPPGA